MLKINSLSDIQILLEPKPKVVIVMHRGPDGDAIGSSLGWYHILAKVGIESTVIAPDGYPDFLKWMPDNEEVIVYESNKEKAAKAVAQCDLIFCLDFNSPSRMGDLEKLITDSGKPMVVVDHHQEPADFADAYYVDDEASSTAELIYRLAKALGWKKQIDHSAAICLYTGIVTDTGSFRFASVSPKLMKIAAKLLETGIDHTEIYKRVFDSNTLERLRLRGFALSERLELLAGSTVAYISLTSADLHRFDFRKGDTEGLVNYALSIDGVEMAAFFAEKDGIIKISFRSKNNYDVNQFARSYFEGGGHKNAAGGKSELKMEETIGRFKTIVKEEKALIKPL